MEVGNVSNESYNNILMRDLTLISRKVALIKSLQIYVCTWRIIHFGFPMALMVNMLMIVRQGHAC